MQQSTQGTKLENKDKADKYYTMYGKSHTWNVNYTSIAKQVYSHYWQSKHVTEFLCVFIYFCSVLRVKHVGQDSTQSETTPTPLQAAAMLLKTAESSSDNVDNNYFSN